MEPGLELCEFDHQAGKFGASSTHGGGASKPQASRLGTPARRSRPSRTTQTCGSAAVEVGRSDRGRADCENRIKELNADFRLESFNLRDFWATEAALTATMRAYNPLSLFRQSVMRGAVQSTMATLRHQVLPPRHGAVPPVIGTPTPAR